VRCRPALVIAAPSVHARFSVVWVLMITSAERVAWPRDVAISDLSAAGLVASCYVRAVKSATIDTRFVEAIGALAPADRLQVAQRLRTMLEQIFAADS
jgi:mRNA-degrading endonuclease toxin of MazEF toxin-antitoxin module